MTDKTLNKLEDVIVWILLSAVSAGFALLIAFGVVSIVRTPSNEKVHTETMYVNDHQYLIFYNKDGDVKYIEHSPDCDCYTVDYD